MKMKPTPIEGVTVLEPDVLSDGSGILTPMFVREEMSAVMGNRQIARVNHSSSSEAGTLRGFQLQVAPREETKIVQCLRGRVFDVAFDLRKGSPTFGRYHGEVLDAESRRMLLIPEGFGHAFQTLEPDTDVMYFITGEHAPECEMSINATGRGSPVTWPLPAVCRSGKDMEASSLDQLMAGGFAGVDLSPQWRVPAVSPNADLHAAGRSMMRERNLLSALKNLLMHCRSITVADAGSIYLVEKKNASQVLRIKESQNDSVNLNYDEIALPYNRASMAGYVAITGELVAVEDVYHMPPGSDYGFNDLFDKGHGYRSKSMLTLPFRDNCGDIIGVLQLINRKPARHIKLSNPRLTEEYVIPFSDRDVQLVSAWVAKPFDAL